LAGFSNRCRTHKNLDRKIIHVPTRFVCCYSQSIGPPPFTYFELYHQTCVSYEPPIVHDDMTRKIYKPPPLSQRPSSLITGGQRVSRPKSNLNFC
jgi:hypothetical protein